MNRIYYLFFSALSVGVFFGCSPLLGGERAAEVQYLIQPPTAGETANESFSYNPASRSLLVSDVRAAAPLGGTRILFTKDGSSIGAYQLARWSESLGNRLQLELVRSLERTNSFASVTRVGTLVSGDLLLSSELLDATHDAREEPGLVRLQLRVELVDVKNGRMIATSTLTSQAPASEFSSSGAVDGFRKAFPVLVEKVNNWLLSHVHSTR